MEFAFFRGVLMNTTAYQYAIEATGHGYVQMFESMHDFVLYRNSIRFCHEVAIKPLQSLLNDIDVDSVWEALRHLTEADQRAYWTTFWKWVVQNGEEQNAELREIDHCMWYMRSELIEQDMCVSCLQAALTRRAAERPDVRWWLNEYAPQLLELFT